MNGRVIAIGAEGRLQNTNKKDERHSNLLCFLHLQSPNNPLRNHEDNQIKHDIDSRASYDRRARIEVRYTWDGKVEIYKSRPSARRSIAPALAG